MKKVECIIRAEKLKDLVAEVEEIGVSGLNINKIAGYGEQKGKQEEADSETDYEIKLKEKLKVEMVIATEKVEGLIEAITASSRTGDIGDGKIFVYAIDKAVRIRTGEENNKAV